MNRFQLILLLLAATLLGTSTVATAQRGWSTQAKDATIGAGIGGAAGAIINKRNRVVGGIIGGAVGGAAGYAIGKNIDTRRKSAARVAAAERDAANARQEANQARQEAEQARQETVAARQAQHEAEDRPVVLRRDEAAAYRSHRSPATPAHVATRAAEPVAPVTAPAVAPIVSLPTSVNAAFLPNPTYGDPDSAYPNSRVRLKSW